MKSIGDKRQYRFLLQSVAAGLLLKKQERDAAKRPERTAVCLRHKTSPTGVEVHQAPNNGRARYGNLQTCGSIWNCSVCAAKISEGRRVELTRAVMDWRAAGNSVAMVTLTFSHSKWDKLQDVINHLAGRQKEGITGAYRRFTSGRAYQKVKKLYGIEGTIKAFEVTHGENGWHPHYHLLIFFDNSKAEIDDPVGLEAEYTERWIACLQREGLRASEEHAVTVSQDDREIDRYTTKWGLEHEITKAVNKEGRKQGRTPQALLRDYAGGDDEAGRLWIEYAEVFKGRSQLQWSRGLKELLCIDEIKDEILAADIKDDDKELGVLADWQWYSIRKLRARGTFLNWVEEYGYQMALFRLERKIKAKKNGNPGIMITKVDLNTDSMKHEMIFGDDPRYEYAKAQVLKHEKQKSA